MRFLALLPLLSLAACTSENPGYHGDGSSGAPDTTTAHDGAPLVADGVGAVDVEPARDTLTPPDSESCAPGSFIACQSPTVMARCNDDGDGPLLIDCAPSLCNAVHQRCNECDPAAKPICVGDNVGYCTPEGLKAIKPCPDGCDNGKCKDCLKKSYYQDADKDGFGDPSIKTMACEKPPGFVENSLDCDDGEPKAFLGQQQFFTKPTKGNQTFDYNCDNVEQPQSLAKFSCKKTYGGCVGEGWFNAPPACGQPGGWGECHNSPVGTKECVTALSIKIQACR